MTKIAVIYYSMYNHVKGLTDGIVQGIKAGAPGAQVDTFLVPETLPKEVLTKMHAQPQPELPTITAEKLKEYDAFAFGIPTRYGRTPAQWSAFFDTTGGLWFTKALRGKMGTIYTSTASQNGGQETTALTTMPFFAHHGIIYVPFGYADEAQSTLDSVQGGSAYGAGTVAGGQGQRAVSADEMRMAKGHGEFFGQTVNAYVKGQQS